MGDYPLPYRDKLWCARESEGQSMSLREFSIRKGAMRTGAMSGLVLGVCLWALPADAIVPLGPPPTVGEPGACCQMGTTYGPLATTPVSCSNVGPGPGLNLCAFLGGT